MAYDKAVDSTALETGLTTIADAIRAKGGTDAPLEFPQGMADAVAAISGGGDPETQNALDALLTLDGRPFVVRSEMSGTLKAAFTDTGITEIYLPNCTKTAVKSFRLTRKLTIAELPKVENLAPGLFYQAAVKKLDFHNLKTMAKWSLDSLARLDTLIIRTPEVCIMEDPSSIIGGNLSYGAGYIYVPKSLIDQYKVASNWVKYADQFRAIEDYPEITGG